MMGLGGGPAHTYRGVNLDTSTVPSGVADQAGPTRTGSVAAITGGGPGGSGQTVTFGAFPSEVTGVRFSLNGVGTRFGSVRLAAYALSGAVPSGAPLAFSPHYGMEDMATGDTDTYFPLSGWTPSASTQYGFVLEPFNYYRLTSHGMLIGSAAGGYADGVNVDNAIESPSPIDAQNAGWSATAGTDLDFTVYSVSGSDTASSSSPDDIEKLAPSQIMMAAITRRPRYPR